MYGWYATLPQLQFHILPNCMKIGGTKEQELKQQQLKQEIKNVGRPVQNAKIE